MLYEDHKERIMRRNIMIEEAKRNRDMLTNESKVNLKSH